MPRDSGGQRKLAREDPRQLRHIVKAVEKAVAMKLAIWAEINQHGQDLDDIGAKQGRSDISTLEGLAGTSMAFDDTAKYGLQPRDHGENRTLPTLMAPLSLSKAKPPRGTPCPRSGVSRPTCCTSPDPLLETLDLVNLF